MAAAAEGALPKACSCVCTCRHAAPASPAQPGLFVDEDFPARWNVLSMAVHATAWLRPHEIREKPRLFVDECSRHSVTQGQVGDCWFLAACAAIAERPDLLKKVIPEGQVLYGPGYDGSVTFRLWYKGEWQNVRIDDRIPVDARGVPVYAHSDNLDEFWLPLLEKAFAKFNRDFAKIGEGGWLSEGMVTITGFSTQLIQTEDWNIWNRENHFQTIKKASEAGAIIVCDSKRETAPGYTCEHAYTITKVYERLPQAEGEQKLQLIRVRNPWGNYRTCGRAAVKHDETRWEKLSDEIKAEMGYRPQENGEFWIDVKQFNENFNDVVIGTEKPKGAEKMKLIGQIGGEWPKDRKTGGDHSNMGNFAKNPQYMLVYLNDDTDAEGENEGADNTADVPAVIELMRSPCRKIYGHSPLILFYVFEPQKWPERRLTAEELLDVSLVRGATEPLKEAAVHALVHLRPGRRLLVVPATKEPGEQAHFVLRVFAAGGRALLSLLGD